MPTPISTISLIIPCYRDTAALSGALLRLGSLSLGVAFPALEILVADGSPAGDCRGLAERFGARHIACPVRGRGPQLAYAAVQATGDLLVFLHADTVFESAHLRSLVEHFEKGPLDLCGVFYRDFSWQYPRLHWLEDFSRFWQREISVLYGDQTQFFRQTHYWQLGGYPDFPLMEDVAMSDAMRAGGGLVLLDPPIRSSRRRFQKLGWWRTKWRNLAIIAAFRLGVSPQRLYSWYYAQ